MSDHDATREILAAADIYAGTVVVRSLSWERHTHKDVVDARAHLETTIRRVVARGLAIEAAARAYQTARVHYDENDWSEDDAGWDVAWRQMADTEAALFAALAAGAGATTEDGGSDE